MTKPNNYYNIVSLLNIDYIYNRTSAVLFLNTKNHMAKEVIAKKIDPKDLKPGMTVRIYQKIKELNAKGEEKERVQYYEGLIIAKKHGNEAGGTITVRKISDGVGVEKIFPLNLPTLTKIEIKKQIKVRRAKLYYLRNYNKKLKEVKLA